MLSAAPWVGSFLGLMFSVVVIGGLAVLIYHAGVNYALPKWAIKIVSSRLAH
jgi:hypothetical protein